MPIAPIFKFDDDQVIEALAATRCNLTQAAVLLAKRWGRSCHRTYVARVVKQRPRLAEYVREHRERVADQAEANIFQRVLNGDYKASVQVVQTLGKDRGWVTRTKRRVKPAAGAIATARKRAKAMSEAE